MIYLLCHRLNEGQDICHQSYGFLRQRRGFNNIYDKIVAFLGEEYFLITYAFLGCENNDEIVMHSWNENEEVDDATSSGIKRSFHLDFEGFVYGFFNR